ncbi:MAG: Ig-like domain-containing protein, partial [Lachnospiraceae bacterium]|nr:Ig-like domain-containing protein [Lachnospiraceae bacterium]
MKVHYCKRVGIITMAICMVLGLLLNPINVSAAPVSESEITLNDTIRRDVTTDDEELFSEYVEQTLYPAASYSKKSYNVARSFYLGTNDQKLYKAWLNLIKKVANGEMASTAFTFSASSILDTTTLSFSDIGITKIDDLPKSQLNDAICDAAGINTGDVYDALLLDTAYEMYWHDKTSGVATSLACSVGSNYITINSLTVSMYVSADYSASGNKGTFQCNTTKTSAAKNTAANAAAVVNAAVSSSDYNKLVYYRDWIINNVSYNYAAIGNGSTAYGDPWQLIYVFDGDDNTNVVCEGYSKAFKYLCDLTDFSSSYIEAHLMTGDMDGVGHMWNAMQMEDGKNYLVDVTNYEPAYGSDLFLSGYYSKSGSGYVYKIGSASVSYEYDSDSLNAYTDEELAMSQTAYVGGGVIPVTGVSVSPSSGSIKVGGTVSAVASVVPATATNKTVYWSSSNTSVATVDTNGLIAGIKAGTAVITATTGDGGYTAKINITVTAPVTPSNNTSGNNSTTNNNGNSDTTNNSGTTDTTNNTGNSDTTNNSGTTDTTNTDGNTGTT